MEMPTARLATWGVMIPSSPSHCAEQGDGGPEAGGLAPGPPPTALLAGRWGWGPSCNIQGKSISIFQPLSRQP